MAVFMEAVRVRGLFAPRTSTTRTNARSNICCICCLKHRSEASSHRIAITRGTTELLLHA